MRRRRLLSLWRPKVAGSGTKIADLAGAKLPHLPESQYGNTLFNFRAYPDCRWPPASYDL